MNKKYFTNILLAALLLVSVIGLIINSGFYFSYYQPTTVVTLNNNEKLNELAGFGNVASVNRELNQVKFQYATSSEVQQNLNLLNLTTTDYTIATTQQVLTPGWAWGWAQGTLIAVIVYGIALYGFYYSFTNFKQFITKYLNIVINSALGLLVLLGLLSWVSKLYMLTSLSLAALFAAFISFAVLCAVKFNTTNFNAVTWYKYTGIGLVISMIFIVVLLPNNFWLDLALILFATWIIPAVDYLLSLNSYKIAVPNLKLSFTKFRLNLKRKSLKNKLLYLV